MSFHLQAVFHLTMLFFAIDRLIHAVLSLRYPIYWSVRKTKYLFIILWTFGMLATIAVTLASVYKNFRWKVGLELISICPLKAIRDIEKN